MPLSHCIGRKRHNKSFKIYIYIQTGIIYQSKGIKVKQSITWDGFHRPQGSTKPDNHVKKKEISYDKKKKNWLNNYHKMKI